jgi:hypothetical protein
VKITKKLFREMIEEEVQKILKEEKSLLLQAKERVNMTGSEIAKKNFPIAIKNLQDAIMLLIQEISNLKSTK